MEPRESFGDIAYDTGSSNSITGDGIWTSATFVAEGDHDITSASMVLSKGATPVATNGWMELWSATRANGTPIAQLAVSDTIPIANWPATKDFVNFTFSTPYSVVDGEFYALVIKTLGLANDGTAATKYHSSAQSWGNYWATISENSGSSWTNWGHDTTFKVFSSTAVDTGGLTLENSYDGTTKGAGRSVSVGTSTQLQAMAFTASGDHNVAAVDLALDSDNGATGPVTLKIYSLDGSNHPDVPGGLLATSETLAADGLAAFGTEWWRFTFDTPAELEDGVSYALVISHDPVGGDEIKIRESTELYSDESFWPFPEDASQDSGGNWAFGNFVWLQKIWSGGSAGGGGEPIEVPLVVAENDTPSGLSYSGQTYPWLGQSFNAGGKSAFLDSAFLNFNHTGADGTLTASVYACDGSYLPTGSPVATSDPIDTTTIDGTFIDRTLTFDGSVELEASGRYALILTVTGGGYVTCKGSTTAGYIPGTVVDSDDGSSWNSQASADLRFGIYGHYFAQPGVGGVLMENIMGESWGF